MWWLAGCVRLTADDRDLRLPHWADVSVGSGATCAVRLDGTLRCWGEGATFDWAEVPPPGDDHAAVSVGYRHACALRVDGGLRCFGDEVVFDGGHPTDPDGPFTWVEAGTDRTCAGDDDGGFTCFGGDTSWQDGAPYDTEIRDLTLAGHGCVLGVDAALSCWGAGAYTPDTDSMLDPVQVALGEDLSLALLEWDGAVWAGDTITPSRALTQVEGGPFTQIDQVGAGLTCGLVRSEISCVGQVADALLEPPSGPWDTVSVGWSVGCALDGSHRMGCWGDAAQSYLPR
ncbi:MAG: RCC1 domain-containing protein [Myxococcota bacterium]